MYDQNLRQLIRESTIGQRLIQEWAANPDEAVNAIIRVLTDATNVSDSIQFFQIMDQRNWWDRFGRVMSELTHAAETDPDQQEKLLRVLSAAHKYRWPDDPLPV